MAITTYAELQTAVANWLHRADLTTRIPEFITLSESRIARKLRTRATEVEADVATVAGTRTASLPSDFKEVRRVYLNSSPVRFLTYMSPQDYWKRYTSTNQGKPHVYTIEGANIVFGPIPDAVYTAKFQYHRSLPALSSSVHSVFTANPDLYVYGALCAAEPFLKKDDRLPMWKSLFDETLNELSTEHRLEQGPMAMRDDYNPY